MRRHRWWWERTALCALMVAATVGILTADALADVFPNEGIAQNNDTGTNRYNGVKRALYFVVHDDNDTFNQTQWDARVASIRSKEVGTRNFYSESSGGKFDIYYDPVIVDAGIPLNPDGTRPSNWVTLSNNIATGTYGLNLNDYYMYAYDVDDTQPDPNQGWGGLSTGDSIYLQSTSQTVINHEIGHQIGADHAKAIRQLDNSPFNPYYWDAGSETYKPYVVGSSPFTPVPYGAALYEYGNPLDTMGNISGGQFRIREKFQDLNWLTSSQVPNLNSLGAGTYRIYAHDELQSTTKAPINGSDPNDEVYGVVDTYDPGVYYGLTYSRQGKTYDDNNNEWDNQTQTIDIEYRVGTNGLAFYLNGYLMDLDPDGGETYGNNQRLLEVGNGVEDTDLGWANFLVTAGAIGQTPEDIDFGSLNPPPPPIPVDNDWYHFFVDGTGSDSVGHYIDVTVSIVMALNGIDGDLNQDGFLTQADLDLFIAGWLTDTSSLASTDKYYYGDMNFDGITDLADAYLMHLALLNAPSSGMAEELGEFIPEPGSLGLLLLGTMLPVGITGRQRRKYKVMGKA